MSRPPGTHTKRKRANTHRRYTYAIEAWVSQSARMEGKRIESVLRRAMPKHLMVVNRHGETVRINLRLTVNATEHFRRALERYKLAVAAEAPRNPKIKPGGR